MRMIRNNIFICILFPIISFSQTNDFQIWASFVTSDKVTYKTDIDLKYGAKFRENSSLLSESFFDLKLAYEYNKHISCAIGYRDIYEVNTNYSIDDKDRYYIDLNLREKKRRFVFLIRNRYQQQGNINGYDVLFRNKLTIRYNLRKTKIEPSLSAECFYTPQKLIEKARYRVVWSLPVNKKTEVQFSYGIQQQFNKANPETLFILGSRLAYDF